MHVRLMVGLIVFDYANFLLYHSNIDDITCRVLQQCKIDLYKCIKAGNVSKAECLKKYKACIGQLIPTVPPFVVSTVLYYNFTAK